MSNNNSKFDSKQGLLMSEDFVLTFKTPIWPIHLTDKAKSFSKPFPTYTGSARLEGDGERSLYEMFVDKGFQPAVLNLVGVRLLDKETNKLRTFTPEGGFPVVCLVRYTEVGRPEVKIMTKEAPADVTAKFGWKRQPVRAIGASDEERYAFAKAMVLSTMPAALPQQEAEIDEYVAEQVDPFAA